MYPDTQLFIDGKWRPARLGGLLPVRNPATGATIGQVACAQTEDLDEALDATQRAFQQWRRVPAFQRYQILRRAATLLRERIDTIAPLLTMENGKTLTEARGEIASSADNIDWFAEEARRTYGRVVPARAEGVYQLVVKEPVGPVAAFTPWNFPINQTVKKIGPALAAGCSLIVKAPEETPAAVAELVRAFADAGLPPGTLNLVYGVPSEISAYLIPNPIIRKISFTGSTTVGKELAAMAGRHMKRATMELGGHAPVLIFDDADIELAARTMVASKFRNAGQVCISPTRFLVQDGVFDRFLQLYSDGAKALRVGNGLEDGMQMGALANSRRTQAMEALVGDAASQGARLTAGGHRIGAKGEFFEPTVLADVPTQARIMNEEPFGPVAIINRFNTLDDGIREANRLPFALASYAWTCSQRTAHALGAGIEAGMLTINHVGLGLPEVPFGGVKDSGYGSEGGIEALDAYTNSKLISQFNL